MNMTNANRTPGLRRLVLAVLAAATLVPAALAGTYSIVSADYYPVTSPPSTSGGGYMHFDANNPLDLDYGFHTAASAPSNGSFSASTHATTVGMYRWTIHWTGVAGTTPPTGNVACTVEEKGAGKAEAGSNTLVAGTTGTASAQISSDPIFMFGASAYVTSGPAVSGPMGVDDTEYSTYNGANYVPQGTSSFVQVDPVSNTWEAVVLMSVNSQADASAQGQGTVQMGKGGQYIYGVQTGAGATVDLDVVERLTIVGGQRLQPDL